MPNETPPEGTAEELDNAALNEGATQIPVLDGDQRVQDPEKARIMAHASEPLASWAAEHRAEGDTKSAEWRQGHADEKAEEIGAEYDKQQELAQLDTSVLTAEDEPETRIQDPEKARVMAHAADRAMRGVNSFTTAQYNKQKYEETGDVRYKVDELERRVEADKAADKAGEHYDWLKRHEAEGRIEDVEKARLMARAANPFMEFAFAHEAEASRYEARAEEIRQIIESGDFSDKSKFVSYKVENAEDAQRVVDYWTHKAEDSRYYAKRAHHEANEAAYKLADLYDKSPDDAEDKQDKDEEYAEEERRRIKAGGK